MKQYFQVISFKTKIFIVVTVILLAIVGPVSFANAAGSASLYFAQSTASVNNGNNLVVNVQVNSGGEPVNGVTAAINYDASKFDYIGVDSSGSLFSVSAPDTINSGSLEITRASYQPVSGAQFVFRVTLRAKSGSGNSIISLNKANSIVTDSATSSNILTSVQNETVTFTTPTAKTPAPPADTTPPAVAKDIAVRPGFNTANFSWKSTEPVRVTIDYGVSKDLGLSSSSGDLEIDHALALDFMNLLPGTTYYYRIKSIDAGGNVSQTDVATFITKGYKIILTLKDSKGKLLKNTDLQLFSEPQSGKTDKKGVATFSEVAPGIHTVKMTVDGKKVEQAIEVKDVLDTGVQAVETGDPKAQELTVTMAVTQKATLPIIPLIAAILLVLGAVAILVVRKKRSSLNSISTLQQGSMIGGQPALNSNTVDQNIVPTQLIHPEPRDPDQP